VAILPLSEKYNEYAENLLELLKNSDIRGFVDDRNEKVGKKIREAELGKIPYMLIVGEKEVENNQVAVRQRGEGDLGVMDVNEFVKLINDKIEQELAFNA
jgi:threonyl-tRNA synthetase